MDPRILTAFMILGLLTMITLRAEGLLKSKANVCIAMVLTAVALILRGALFNYETLDYQHFLTKWVSYFSQHGAWNSLADNVGNYNVPYLYFMALFSLSSIKDLYLIKLLSIVFDFVLAFGAERLLSIYRNNHQARLGCFFATLFLPTVVLNGALWGQCDCIYAAFAVLAVYYGISGKPVPAMALAAVSFAFKLQAVFFLPFFVILLIMKKVKLWHFAVFPATYVICVLPAVIAGRPFMDTLLLYFSQADTVGSSLNYNSSSIFAIIDPQNHEAASLAGVAAAFIFMIMIFAIFLLNRKRWGKKEELVGALILCIGIPFLLPHMHERYFFMADILSLVLAFVFPAAFAVPFLVSFASFLGYYAYLRMRFLMPMRYGAYAFVCALIILFITLSAAGIKDESKHASKNNGN